MEDCLGAEVFTWVCGTGTIYRILSLALSAVFIAFIPSPVSLVSLFHYH